MSSTNIEIIGHEAAETRRRIAARLCARCGGDTEDLELIAEAITP